MYEKTKAMIHEFLSVGIFPSADFVFIHGNETERETLGWAQMLPTREKIRPDMLYDVASLTKVIGTTTLILKLLQQKKIQLDAPLKTYLPEYCDENVTIRELLTHTSGINSYIPNRDQLGMGELKNALLRLLPDIEGEHPVTYTDTNFLLLGFLLEHLEDKPVQQLISEQVLNPLKLTHSTFSPVHASDCVPTELARDSQPLRGRVHDPKAAVLQHHCGSAGLFMPVSDCLTFTKMLLASGRQADRRTYLQKDIIQLLLCDQTPSRNQKRSLGWDLRHDLQTQAPILFHTGYTGTFLLIDIHAQEAFIFFSNRVHPYDQRREYLVKRDQLIACYLNEKARKAND